MVSSPRRKKKRVGLSRLEENRIREKLLQFAPSEPWVDVQFVRIEDVSPAGEEIVYRLHQPKLFPPGGKATKMVECPICGRTVPPNAIEKWNVIVKVRGRVRRIPFVGCMDHQPDRYQEGYGASPSAVAIRALQMRNLRLEDVKLEPESKAALREEIRAFERKRSRNSRNVGR